jgi:AhpD family alkylhydroperoxidase
VLNKSESLFKWIQSCEIELNFPLTDQNFIFTFIKPVQKDKNMSKKVQEFREYRQEMNKRLLAADNKIIKRIFNLDTNTYVDGALTAREKEMMGLVASMVLRCDDCIKYHLETCFELGLTKDQIMEIFAVANLVGGTIVIPHTRRALEYWDELGSME